MSSPQPVMRAFDLQFVAITLGSLICKGFAAGDAMVAEFPSDDFEFEAGSDGEVLWIRKHNPVANVTLRFAQGNPLIDQARELHAVSLASGGLTYPFGAKNLKGTEILAGSAMILVQPPMRWSDSAQPVELKLGLAVKAWAGGLQLTPGL